MKHIDRRTFFKQSMLLASLIPFSAFLNPLNANTSFKPSQMTKRILGRNALVVSALGFGAMGLSYNRGEILEKHAAIKLLHQCVDYGITLFDTAEIYGPYTNEILLGEALSGYKDIKISTKFGHKIIDGVYHKGELDSHPQTIKRVCDESLRRLKRDRIDIFYQHRLDPKVPIEDVALAVKDLVQAGKVAHFGLCEVNAKTIEKAHAIMPVVALQSEYHLMWRDVENNILDTLNRLGIGFVPYSPLNRGFLSGKITANHTFDANNDNRAKLPRFSPKALEANYRIIDVLSEFAKDKKATVAQIALSYLLAKKPFIVPIFGTTKLEHLEENLGALHIKWTKSELSHLENAVDSIKIVGDRYDVKEQKQVEK